MKCSVQNEEHTKYLAKGLCHRHYHRRWYNLLRSQFPDKTRQLNTERKKRYRSTEKGREASRRAVRTYELRHPERRNAWNKASVLERQIPCTVCGSLPTHKHHPNINNPLEINYLCPLHHKAAHLL